MNRAVTTLFIAVLTIATAPAAFSAPRGQECERGARHNACAQPRKGEARKEGNARAQHNEHRTRHERKIIKTRGHALSKTHARRLPKPPRGQEYRVIDNRVVRIDSETLQTVAVLGLLQSLLN
ncbi:RcnB family protein [Oceanicola sp. D3]|uniref:RcnB family protein n=1 Tax=Oceanicola sp. D3 TaxID=2587163 RepID=UPI0011248179|nr:RcnB family protein [Oceanicola sp. D3]QDC10428.1 RcnB family protein [Oceanicola sp. D3]